VTQGGAILCKECHNCIFKSVTEDASVHMDYYTGLFTKQKLETAPNSIGAHKTGCETGFHYR